MTRSSSGQFVGGRENAESGERARYGDRGGTESARSAKPRWKRKPACRGRSTSWKARTWRQTSTLERRQGIRREEGGQPENARRGGRPPRGGVVEAFRTADRGSCRSWPHPAWSPASDRGRPSAASRSGREIGELNVSPDCFNSLLRERRQARGRQGGGSCPTLTQGRAGDAPYAARRTAGAAPDAVTGPVRRRTPGRRLRGLPGRARGLRGSPAHGRGVARRHGRYQVVDRMLVPNFVFASDDW